MIVARRGDAKQKHDAITSKAPRKHDWTMVSAGFHVVMIALERGIFDVRSRRRRGPL